jgi:hypothetical protein
MARFQSGKEYLVTILFPILHGLGTYAESVERALVRILGTQVRRYLKSVATGLPHGGHGLVDRTRGQASPAERTSS